MTWHLKTEEMDDDTLERALHDSYEPKEPILHEIDTRRKAAIGRLRSGDPAEVEAALECLDHWFTVFRDQLFRGAG